MTIKQYTRIKLFFTVIIAIIFAQAIIYRNFWIPVATLIMATLVLIYLRRQVSEIIADERDYFVAGKAAFLAMQIYAWCATLGMLVLYVFRDYNPAYEPIAITLAYSTCFLMILHSLIFRYHNKISLSGKKIRYIILAAFFFAVLIVLSIRLFSGEDDWTCKDGQWAKHGQPSFPAPKSVCK